MMGTHREELRRLRTLLDLEWPGFADSAEDIALPDAPAALAETFGILGWSSSMAPLWPDPRATDHEERVRDWINEGRLEYERFDDDLDDDAEPDPETVDTDFPVERAHLPARLRVLRQRVDGGDYSLWIADEATGDDPEVLELALRPTWTGELVDGFVRRLPERVSRLVPRWMVGDLAERRAHGALIDLTEPRAHGQALLPSLVPDVFEVASHVYLELNVAPGARPHRLSSHDLDALRGWLASVPPTELTPPAMIGSVESTIRLPS